MKKIVALISTMALGMGILAGCGNSSTTTDKVDSSKVTVDIFQFKVEAKDALEKAAKEYTKAHPDVTFNVQTVGGGQDYGAALKSRFASGKEPTIYNVGGAQDVKDWKASLEDLSGESWVSKAFAGTLDSVTTDGKIYGMPFNQEGYGFIYNKDIFQKAGIDPTTINTYADLEGAVKKLDGMKSQLGLTSVFALPGKETWVTGLHLSNVALSNEFSNAKASYESKTVDFKYGDGLKKLLDLQIQYGYKSDGTNKSINSVDYSTQVEKMFSLGKSAIIQQGNWVYGSVKGIDDKVAGNMGILPMPLDGVKDGSIPVGVPMYWAVNSKQDDAKKKAAKDFLNWLYTSDKGKDMIINDFNFIPPFKGYDGDNLQPKDPLAKEIFRYVNSGKTMPWVFMGYPTGWGQDKLGASLQKYISGDITWDKLISDSKASWTELRNK